MSRKRATPAVASQKNRNKKEDIEQLRTLAHDLSNALEAILQASYLLGQAKLDDSNHRWAQLIESSSEQAAKINREMRKLLRAISEG